MSEGDFWVFLWGVVLGILLGMYLGRKIAIWAIARGCKSAMDDLEIEKLKLEQAQRK